jgi:hypothetical protein
MWGGGLNVWGHVSNVTNCTKKKMPTSCCTLCLLFVVVVVVVEGRSLTTPSVLAQRRPDFACAKLHKKVAFIWISVKISEKKTEINSCF